MKEERNISYYLHWFDKIKVDKSKGSAPNKPILLLSILDLFDNKLINSNRIEITPELVSLFQENWNLLVEDKRNRKFSLPFFHLRTSPFWNLIPNRGFELAITSIHSISSLSKLKEIVDSAEIDYELYSLIREKDNRKILAQLLLEKYFPNVQSEYFKVKRLPYSKVNLDIKPNEYKSRILELKEKLDNNDYQEQVFIRSGAFRSMILQNYNDTCAISGMKVVATENLSMLDACHIVPFSESYDDTSSNGIALAPTLHRAFDRGLIFISDTYKVILNKNFKENRASCYNLKQFEGKEIRLPQNREYLPSQSNFRLHRNKFNF